MNTEQINDGGPAFPCEYRHHEYADAPHLQGMSLRAYLTGQALAGLAPLILNQIGADEFGKMAVALADSTLAALNRKEGA